MNDRKFFLRTINMKSTEEVDTNSFVHVLITKLLTCDVTAFPEKQQIILISYILWEYSVL